jgi:tRNA G18 (ribose-2'-O)-methylase SpoU
MYKERIEDNLKNFYNVRDEYQHMDVETIQTIARGCTLPYRVCAVNVEGDLNVGMMARSASLLGAEKFYVFGRRKIDNRSLVGVQNYLDIQRIGAIDEEEQVDFSKFVDLCATEKLFPILFETSGPPLTTVNWESYFYMAADKYKVCLVFGNESDGFPQEFLDSPIPRISIPQLGVLRSFNVAAAASIVMWDLVSRYFKNV